MALPVNLPELWIFLKMHILYGFVRLCLSAIFSLMTTRRAPNTTDEWKFVQWRACTTKCVNLEFKLDAVHWCSSQNKCVMKWAHRWAVFLYLECGSNFNPAWIAASTLGCWEVLRTIIRTKHTVMALVKAHHRLCQCKMEAHSRTRHWVGLRACGESHDGGTWTLDGSHDHLRWAFFHVVKLYQVPDFCWYY